MRPNKLANLLSELNDRLLRIERMFLQSTAAIGPARTIVEKLSSVSMEVQRYLSKPDTLRVADVEKIEDRLLNLDAAIGDLTRQFSQTSSLGRALRVISSDVPKLRNLTSGMRIGLNQLRPDEVLELIPGQKTAAFQFALLEDRLVTVDQPLRTGQSETEMAMAAFETALEHGVYVNQDMEGTNVSPRLKDAFIRLQEVMVSYKNIVQIGQRAQICNKLIHAEVEELSQSQFGLLIGHVELIFSTLAQFKDWREFTENAVAANFDPDSISKLTESTGALRNQLREIPSVDRSVEVALTTVEGWVASQEQPDKRDVLSLARTIENLWSAVTKVVLSVGRETISEAKKMAAKAILAVLLTVATTVVLMPVFGYVPGAQWIQTTYSYLTSGGKLSSP